MHKARWLSRIFYSFKFCMFRGQFTLRAGEEKGLLQFLLFVSKTFIKAWFEAPQVKFSPLNDLQLLKDIQELENDAVRRSAITALYRQCYAILVFEREPSGPCIF